MPSEWQACSLGDAKRMNPRQSPRGCAENLARTELELRGPVIPWNVRESLPEKVSDNASRGVFRQAVVAPCLQEQE